MRTTHTHAKLFMLAGALCFSAAFVVAFAATVPNIQAEDMTAAVAGSMSGSSVAATSDGPSVEEFAARSMLLLGERPTPAPTDMEARQILVDIDKKTLTVTEGTSTIATFPVLSVGKEGTFWETPAGDYSVKTKEVKHLSSIGGTWMPWSMQFYGNFFVHGWPTYQDGSDVPKGYSGGCIRLSTDDAKELYGLVGIGTRLKVSGGTLPSLDADMRYYMKNAEALPSIEAKAFSVFDEETGQVLWSRGEDQAINPGKLVALLTSLVSVETIDQYKYVDFEKLVAGKDSTHAKASTVGAVQVGALLYPLLFDGSDIAARGIVELRGKKVFRNYMNEKSKAIGMQNSEWAGGTSLTVSTTTPRDLATLLTYIDKQKSFLVNTTLALEHSFDPPGQTGFQWKNKNAWLGDGSFRGGLIVKEKEGGGSALALYTLPVSEFGERKLGFVVAQSPHADIDLTLLKEYASAHFFFGTQSSIEAVYAATSDPAGTSEGMKLIKEQLLN